jgi:hypothetical protein
MHSDQRLPDDQEPPTSQPPPDRQSPKRENERPSLSGVSREVNSREANSPLLAKTLMDDVERLQKEKTELHGFREKFHETDKRAAILEEKNKLIVSQEILSYSLGGIGGAVLGYSLSILKEPLGWLVLVLGVVLLAAGAWAKVTRP